MTPQEAIDFIDNEVQIDVRYCSIQQIDKTREVFSFAKEALEKQIPKKPYYFGDGYANGMLVYDEARCPVCEGDFEEGMTNWGCKFCPDCGQALDWSDTE